MAVAQAQSSSGFAALAARNEAETDARALCAGLSPHVLDVLVLTANGLRNCEVASALCKSNRTVEAQLSIARRALGVASNIEAAVILTKAGLV